MPFRHAPHGSPFTVHFPSWCRERDSNPHRSEFKSDASAVGLPRQDLSFTSHFDRKFRSLPMAEGGGVEPRARKHALLSKQARTRVRLALHFPKLVAPEGFEPSRPCGPELLRLVRLPGSATGRSQRRRARHRSISEGGAARNSRTPTPGRSRRRLQFSFLLLVPTGGVEPPPPPCQGGALPLSQADNRSVW